METATPADNRALIVDPNPATRAALQQLLNSYGYSCDQAASLADALGPQATVSKSTVSRICQAIKDEFDAWTTRDLGGIELEYLFLDGSHFRMHPGAPAEPVLAA